MSRISYSIKNVKVSLLFYFLMLVLNFFSRRVFIDRLGEDLVGLSGSVMSYIGMLNLAELGIGVAITNALYAPLFREDRGEVTEIISLFGWLFRLVGLVILGAGLVFAVFLPWIFKSAIAAGTDVGFIYAAFGTFLVTTLLSYLVNYKQNLLMANQKGYVVTKVLNTCTILKVLLQIALLEWLGGGYLSWLAVEIVFGVVFAVWLEVVVRREYPWLDSSVRQGRRVVRRYGEVFRNVKRIFAHRVAGQVLVQSDVVVIQLFTTLTAVTAFTNYAMVIQRVTQFVTGTLQNSYAGVGHLVAEGDRSKIKLVFWQFNAMYFWLGGTVAFGFYMLMDPFIALWLPGCERFVGATVALLAVTLFFGMVRQTVQYFLNAYGLFQDVWAAWTEAGLNVAISVWACWHFGVIGVVAGTAVSTGLLVLLWKPYFLYSQGFRESSSEYWATILKYIALLGVVWIGVRWLTGLGWLPTVDTWGGLAVNAVVVPGLYLLVSGVAMYLCSGGMRALVRLWRGLLMGALGRLREKFFAGGIRK